MKVVAGVRPYLGAVLLLALLLSQTPQPRLFQQPNLPREVPDFVAFGADGAGLAYAADLCDQLTADEKVGDWTCFNGDGTTEAGGRALTKTGSDRDATHRTCPNGPDCGALAARDPGGAAGARWESTTSTRVGSADITICSLAVPNGEVAGEQPLLGWAENSSSSGLGISPYFSTSGTVFSAYYATAGGCVSVSVGSSAVTLVPGALHFVCTRIKDSATDLDMFVDGVKTVVATVGVNLGCTTAGAHIYGVNAYGPGTTRASASLMHGAFATEVALSDARILELSHAVLADVVKDASNTTIALTRAGVKFCPSSSGFGSYVPTNRTCIAQNGYVQDPARSNVALRSEKPSNAAWTPTGGPTLTSNDTVAPTGLMAADTINDTNAGATAGVFQQAVNAATGIWTSSCWLLAGTQTVARLTVATDGTGTTTCSFTGLSTTEWQQKQCTTTVGGVPTYKEMAVYPGPDAAATGTIKAWGCQLEAGDTASSALRTTTAAYVGAADVHAGIVVSTTGLASFSAAATFLTRYVSGSPNPVTWGQFTATTPSRVMGGVRTPFNGLSSTFGTVQAFGQTWTAPVSKRTSVAWRGVSVVNGVTLCFDGFACDTQTADATALGGTVTFFIGANTPGTTIAPQVLKNLCVDLNGAGCTL